MKAAIKLVLINLLVTQIVAPLLIAIPCVFYLVITTGTCDQHALMQILLIPAQLVGQLMMGVYLWKAGYFPPRREMNTSAVSVGYLLCASLAMLSSSFVVSSLMSRLNWIPNLMEQSFNILQSGWAGIAAIALVGPVLEELLFRGAITRILLQSYSPTKAILLSALLFSVFHINPAQMIPAFLIGILLGWVYYQTRSLIPCILMHILNNSIAVYLSIRYPEVENIDDLISGTPYLFVLTGCAICLIATVAWMYRMPTKTDTHKRIETA